MVTQYACRHTQDNSVWAHIEKIDVCFDMHIIIQYMCVVPSLPGMKSSLVITALIIAANTFIYFVQSRYFMNTVQIFRGNLTCKFVCGVTTVCRKSNGLIELTNGVLDLCRKTLIILFY